MNNLVKRIENLIEKYKSSYKSGNLSSIDFKRNSIFNNWENVLSVFLTFDNLDWISSLMIWKTFESSSFNIDTLENNIIYQIEEYLKTL